MQTTPARIPRLLIAGTHSGVGKTTLTAGLIAALCRAGLDVQPFKVGPDYIDPSYHSLAAGRVCRNLDTWMVPSERVAALFGHAVTGADLAVIEGVMGLYDGFGYLEDAGSTAEVAKLLGAPVVLALDAGCMARSAGAVALGYQQFDPQLPLAGFLVNRVAGESHGQGVAAAIEQATGLPVLGWIPRETGLVIPERHLGLVPTAEPGKWRAFIEAAADLVARQVDLARLQALANDAPPLAAAPLIAHPSQGDHRPRIAVARDEAFSFTYADNLDLLRMAGAEIVFFSPLHDAALPPNTAGVMLSGGFPELYAAQLAANGGMCEALRQAHARGLPLYAECGGLMVLTEAILDLEGRAHPMLGLLPGRCAMTSHLTMGYRVAEAACDSPLLRQGETVRAHEFHYSAWEGRPHDLPPAYYVRTREGQEPRPEGACIGNLLASYAHVHLAARPELAPRFVAACAQAAP